MKTWLTTFEQDLRRRLLDVVHGQWHDLGLPFSNPLRPNAGEIIDPEALLWCSLEFLPTEPRLREGVTAWLDTQGKYIIRQRIKRLATKGDPRIGIWHVLDRTRTSRPEVPTEPCHGLDSAAEVSDFCDKLASGSILRAVEHTPPGRPIEAPSTILLRARDLLGGGLRHALLVYLLANPDGGKLKTLERWSRYSYRSISETAARWEAAGVLVIEHGYCRLTNPKPWDELLQHQAGQGAIVNWIGVFDASVGLLRALAKAGRKGLGADSPVVSSLLRDTESAFSSAILGGRRNAHPSVSHIHELLQGQVTRLRTSSGPWVGS